MTQRQVHTKPSDLETKLQTASSEDILDDLAQLIKHCARLCGRGYLYSYYREEKNKYDDRRPTFVMSLACAVLLMSELARRGEVGLLHPDSMYLRQIPLFNHQLNANDYVSNDVHSDVKLNTDFYQALYNEYMDENQYNNLYEWLIQNPQERGELNKYVELSNREQAKTLTYGNMTINKSMVNPAVIFKVIDVSKLLPSLTNIKTALAPQKILPIVRSLSSKDSVPEERQSTSSTYKKFISLFNWHKPNMVDTNTKKTKEYFETKTDEAALNSLRNQQYMLASHYNQSVGETKRDALLSYIQFLEKNTVENYLNMLKHKNSLVWYSSINTSDNNDILLMNLQNTRRLEGKKIKELYLNLKDKSPDFNDVEKKSFCILELNQYIFTMQQDSFNRNQYNKMMAALAYKNFLIHPSELTFKEMTQYASQFNNGRLKQIVAIAPIPEKNKANLPLGLNLKEEICKDKLHAYIQLLNNNKVFAKDKEKSAATACLRYLVNPNNDNLEAVKKHRSVLSRPKLASIIMPLSYVFQEKSLVQERTTNRPRF